MVDARQMLTSGREEVITATYIITPTRTLVEAQAAIERFTSVSTEANLDRLLDQIAPLLGVRGDQNAQDFVRRLKGYSARLARPVLLPDSKSFLTQIEVPAKSINLVVDGVPHLLALFAGNLFRTNQLTGIKWIDLDIPPAQIAAAPTLVPKYGLPGIRQMLGPAAAEKRPLIAANIQPAFGLTAQEFAAMCRFVGQQGVEILVEDELLRELEFCTVVDRITHVTAQLEADRRPRLYLVNVMSWSDDHLRSTAAAIKEANKRCRYVQVGVTIDPFFAGFPLVRYFRESVECPIFCHYYSSGFFTRSPEFGVSLKVLSQLAAVAGADITYIGSIHGGHVSEDPAIIKYLSEFLREMQPVAVFPALAGGVCAQNLTANLRHFGVDTVLHVGSGIFGHPLGPAAGATVFRVLIDLATKCCLKNPQRRCDSCTNFVEALGKHPELKLTFDNQLPVH